MVRHQTMVADIVVEGSERRRLQQQRRRRTVRRRAEHGRISIDLKPRSERTLSVDQIMAELRPKVSQVPGIRVFMVNQPPINLGGQQGARSLYQFTLQDTDTVGAVPVGADPRREDSGDRRASRTSAATCS